MRLPAEFADLEPYADWALATEKERYAKRLASSMEEMQRFYDAALPRLTAAIEYCDRFLGQDDRPEEVPALLNLMQSLINVSFPIEVWKQPRVTDCGHAFIECTVEPAV
ncbi:hypothetical protein ACWDYH_20455 [Nocardia goodfellowii]